jgi:transcriptional regulator with XRE-family HTH domain
MQTERQYQKRGYRKDTSQLPRNRHSVAAWMADMDRQRGERIRDLREAHAWTQRQLADRLQVDPKTVHNWEKGKDLLGDNLRDLAECFDTSMNYIRYGEREAPDLGELLNSNGNGSQSQLDRIEANQQTFIAEAAALRVEVASLATQLEDRFASTQVEVGTLTTRLEDLSRLTGQIARTVGVSTRSRKAN